MLSILLEQNHILISLLIRLEHRECERFEKVENS
jgi:hypothetical protein